MVKECLHGARVLLAVAPRPDQNVCRTPCEFLAAARDQSGGGRSRYESQFLLERAGASSEPLFGMIRPVPGRSYNRCTATVAAAAAAAAAAATAAAAHTSRCLDCPHRCPGAVQLQLGGQPGQEHAFRGPLPLKAPLLPPL